MATLHTAWSSNPGHQSIRWSTIVDTKLDGAVLILGCLDDEVGLALRCVRQELCRVESLRVEESLHFLVLHLIQDPLQKLLKVVLAHDGVLHGQESFFRVGPYFLACVLEVVGEDGDELVRIFEEENVVAHSDD